MPTADLKSVSTLVWSPNTAPSNTLWSNTTRKDTIERSGIAGNVTLPPLFQHRLLHARFAHVLLSSTPYCGYTVFENAVGGEVVATCAFVRAPRAEVSLLRCSLAPFVPPSCSDVLLAVFSDLSCCFLACLL